MKEKREYAAKMYIALRDVMVGNTWENISMLFCTMR